MFIAKKLGLGVDGFTPKAAKAPTSGIVRKLLTQVDLANPQSGAG